MSRIVVVMHEHSRRFWRTRYLVSTFVPHWQTMGHEVEVVFGAAHLPDADAAFLHVDLSVTPPDYVQAIARYPLVINGRVLDIRKRNITRLRVHRGDAWDGPVIAKPDLNYGGVPEQMAAGIKNCKSLRYVLFKSLAEVPAAAFRDERYILERFMPERDGEMYAIRSWVFLGDRERCRRFLSPGAVVKGRQLIPADAVAVPPAIRAERERLGFDFGKFDFVMHGEEAILLDANRSPGAPPAVEGLSVDAVTAELAAGLTAVLRGLKGSE